MRSSRLRIPGWAPPLAALGLVAALIGVARLMRAPPPALAPRGIAAAVLAAASAVRVEPAPPPEVQRCPPEPPLPERALEVPPAIELGRLVREDPSSLGSASIGSPTRGRLWGAVQLVASEGIEPAGGHPWGTELAVRSIERAVREVRRCLPGAPKLHVGDISRKEGGWLRPHRSHQAGLDADVGFYYLSGPAWYAQATAANLDRPRTWALLRALVDGGNVEVIFIDRSLQRLLREHAETVEEDRARLEDFFESAKRKHDVFLRHERGHTGHFHVRFRDPASVALGARLTPFLRGRAPAQRAKGAAPPGKTQPANRTQPAGKAQPSRKAQPPSQTQPRSKTQPPR